MFSNSYDREKHSSEKDSRSSTDELAPAKGDFIYYFIFHNILSSLFFTLAIYFFEFDKSHPYSDLYWVFSWDFFWFFLLCVGLSYLFSLLSSALVYLIIYFYYLDMEQSIKPWGEMESSRYGLLSYFHLLQTIFSNLVYCIGVVTILQQKLFEQNTLLSLIICYLSVKLVVTLIVYVLTKRRRERKKIKHLRKYEKYSKK